MTNKFMRTVLMLGIGALLSSSLVACAGSNTTTPDAPAATEEAPAGEAPAGEAPAGETPPAGAPAQ